MSMDLKIPNDFVWTVHSPQSNIVNIAHGILGIWNAHILKLSGCVGNIDIELNISIQQKGLLFAVFTNDSLNQR